MATYLELGQEPEWQAEFEAPAHAAATTKLRAHYGHTRAQTGSKGDNHHMRGRHRSRAWILGSAYCTNRTYAVTDARDKAGDKNWLRGTDVGITGTVLRAATARLLTAVKAGRLPCIAEFFGTVDGRTVVGWFEGKPGTSDESHLYHLHFGLWTAYCNDAAQLDLLYRIITGEDDDMSAVAENHIAQVYAAIFNGGKDCGTIPPGKPTNSIINKLDFLLARAQAGVPVDVDEAAIAAEVVAQINVPTAAENADAVLDAEAARLAD